MDVTDRTVRILLAEDSSTDVLLTREAFREATMNASLEVVPDGVEAMAFLQRLNPYTQALRPDLVLLDLNLPKKDGFQVLAEMKADAELCQIPVLVLTTSRSEADIRKSYALHANCYIAKPVDFDRFADVVKSIQHF